MFITFMAGAHYIMRGPEELNQVRFPWIISINSPYALHPFKLVCLHVVIFYTNLYYRQHTNTNKLYVWFDVDSSDSLTQKVSLFLLVTYCLLFVTKQPAAVCPAFEYPVMYKHENAYNKKIVKQWTNNTSIS